MSNLSNGTNSDDTFKHYSDHFKKNQLWPLSVIIVVGFLANSIVIINGIRRRKLIMHYSNYFVLSTAFADWWVVVFAIPMMFVEYLIGFKWMSEWICQYVLPVRETFQGAAMFSISTLAVLRVRQITTNPRGQFSIRTCKLIVVVIWVGSFLVSTVPLFDIYKIDEAGICDPMWPSRLRKLIHITVIYCIIISPMIVATISYSIVLVKVTSCLGSDPESVRLRRRNRSITVLLIMLILSCWISYTPMAVFIIVNLFTETELPTLIWNICTVLYFGGSALNPILVLLTMPTEYRFNTQMIRCKRKQRVGIDQPKQDLKSTVALQIRNQNDLISP